MQEKRLLHASDRIEKTAGFPLLPAYGIPAVFISVIDQIVAAEEQGDAPRGGSAHQRVDDARQQSILSAEDPRDKVKLKKADQTPVQPADNGQQ